jgi:hypothetical protein
MPLVSILPTVGLPRSPLGALGGPTCSKSACCATSEHVPPRKSHFFRSPGHPKSLQICCKSVKMLPRTPQRGSGDPVWKKSPPGASPRSPHMPPVQCLLLFLHFPERAFRYPFGSIWVLFWEASGHLGRPKVAQETKKMASKKTVKT